MLVDDEPPPLIPLDLPSASAPPLSSSSLVPAAPPPEVQTTEVTRTDNDDANTTKYDAIHTPTAVKLGIAQLEPTLPRPISPLTEHKEK